MPVFSMVKNKLRAIMKILQFLSFSFLNQVFPSRTVSVYIHDPLLGFVTGCVSFLLHDLGPRYKLAWLRMGPWKPSCLSYIL